jgi:protein-tyrosine-phosphatase/predicted ATP-grasp superfamily ATP-dependent carboligase
MTQSHRKALVLGDDNRSFLSVVRSLGRKGIEVHVAWCSPGLAAARSRYVRRVHDIRPYSENGRWKGDLAALLRGGGFDLVVPCDDRTLLPLQAHRADLEPLARICLLSNGAFGVAFDKLRTYELAAGLGVSVPPQAVIAHPREAGHVASALGLPLVVKPVKSYTLAALTAKNRVRMARSQEQLESAAAELLPKGAVVAQKHFRGHGVGVEVLAAQGEVLVAFQHLRLHEPPTGGGSTYRKSVPLDPRLLAATSMLVHALDYTGVLMAEFRVSPRDNEWVFLELNARFWGSLPLAIAAGVDFPYYLFELLVEGRREFPQRYRSGVSCRNLKKDAAWLVRNLAADRSDPTVSKVPLRRVFAECLNVLTLRERSDTLVADDPLPGAIEAGQAASQALVAGVGALRRAWLSAPALRRAGSARAVRALGRARSVLFVCKGNICRSPFAEHLARLKLSAGREFASAGYYPVARRPPPLEAAQAARSFGVCLDEHRSIVLTADMAEAADVVFVFDDENRRNVVRLCPSARRKVHFLGLLSSGGPAVIRDPFGATTADMRSCYRQIAEAIDSVAGKL